MKNVDRRDQQLPYISDAEVMEQQMNARRLTQQLNTIDRSDFDGIAAIVKELFGKSEGAFVNPPFYCDYGSHIEVGKNFFANYNCMMLDVAKIKIGDNCQMAPNVAIYTAGHPVHPAARNSAYEYGIEVTIGDNVWLGGNTVIVPGVHIGSNVVIGAGSVVAATNPREQGFHFVDIFAFHKARDSLQIAAATADETYVMQFVVLGYVE